MDKVSEMMEGRRESRCRGDRDDGGEERRLGRGR